MKRQLISFTILAILALTVADAKSAESSPAFLPSSPLSPREQASRLAGLTSQAFGRELFPCPHFEIAPALYFQRNYREAWMTASPYDRIGYAERIGEQGRARYATEQGLRKVLGSQGRGIVQGPDAVCWDPYSGRLRTLEAKGQSSPLKRTYDSWQGTNTNSIRSAEFVLKSAKASPVEKIAAARVIKAAQQNHLQTDVVRTKHELGKPNTPRLVSSDHTNVSEEALKIERELVKKNSKFASIFRSAGKTQAWETLKCRAAKGLTTFGLVGAVGIGMDAYEQTREACSIFQNPTLHGTALPYMQLGIAAGKWAECTSLGLSSAAELGLLGNAGIKTFGHTLGKRFLPIAIVVEGLSAGTAYCEYSAGRISQLEFYRRSRGSAIFGACVTGGAVVGGIVGGATTLEAGGVGAIPGAKAGAEIGALVSMPANWIDGWYRDWKYREFNAKQAQVVDIAVDRLYGLK